MAKRRAAKVESEALTAVEPVEAMGASIVDKWSALPSTTKYIVIGGGAAIVLLFLFRKQVGGGLTTLRTTASDAAFKFSIPTAGKPYADIILRVAKEEGLSPFLLAGFMEQESGFGAGLSPPGPTGTGDEGHGRGLMQIDDRSHKDFIAKVGSNGRPLWQDPYENLKYAVTVYRSGVKFFSAKGGGKVTIKDSDYVTKFGARAGTYNDPRPLSGDKLVAAAIAAYNTGAGNVLKALAAGLPADATTTGRKLKTGEVLRYADSVVARASALVGKAQAAKV